MKSVALIIDDEVQIRRLLRLVLEAENYKVHEADTGQQGLMEIANRKPDIVLLDLGLPGYWMASSAKTLAGMERSAGDRADRA